MDWSKDFDNFNDGSHSWFHSGSNMMLDFHGNPTHADLVVSSDGNHHMALKETIKQFKTQTPEIHDIFYATTPPAPIAALLKGETLRIGNFKLAVRPDVFIGPPHVLDQLVAQGYLKPSTPFFKNQGSVLLVKKGNPKNIRSLEDLKRGEIKLFLSNPKTEKVSFEGYRDTLINLLTDKEILGKIDVLYGRTIHHREGPEAVQNGLADAAFLFYHLGLYYTKTYPYKFDMLPLGGTIENPRPEQGNIISYTHAATVKGCRPLAHVFLEFLTFETVKKIYRRHGLLPI
jgi:ABC-type molybdate transport system substrate-binding protein